MTIHPLLRPLVSDKSTLATTPLPSKSSSSVPMYSAVNGLMYDLIFKCRCYVISRSTPVRHAPLFPIRLFCFSYPNLHPEQIPFLTSTTVVCFSHSPKNRLPDPPGKRPPALWFQLSSACSL